MPVDDFGWPAPTYPLVLSWRQEFTDYLNSRNVYTAFPYRPVGLYAAGETVTIPAPSVAEPYCHLPFRSFCSIGAHSYSISPMKPGTVIGRFCSFAHNIVMMGDAHPTDRITTSPLTYSPYFSHFAKTDYQRDFQILPFNPVPQPVRIGNDVWIGMEVMLSGGIKIGDGAIIATRSIVTKDVPPYSVVAGAPATVRKYRFDEDVIERLLKSCWWNYNYFEIPHCWTDPARFLDELEAGIGSGTLQPAHYDSIDIGGELMRLQAQLLENA